MDVVILILMLIVIIVMTYITLNIEKRFKNIERYLNKVYDMFAEQRTLNDQIRRILDQQHDFNTEILKEMDDLK